jgi:hypothetical protein
MNRLQAGRSSDRGLIPGWGKILFFNVLESVQNGSETAAVIYSKDSRNYFFEGKAAVA